MPVNPTTLKRRVSFSNFVSLAKRKIRPNRNTVKIAFKGRIASKLEKKVGKLLRTNGLLYILYLNSFIVLVGSSILSVVEEKSFSDSLWWALVTVTTVGYGDIVPSSIFGKWLAVLLMLVGIGTIGMLTSALTNFFVKDNPDDQIKFDKLQDELITQRILLEKQSEKIDELHRMIQDLLEKK